MQGTNIAIFTNTLNSGGAEKQALLLAKALKDRYTVFLVIYYGDKIEEKYKEIISKNNIKTLKLSGNHIIKAIRLFQFFRANSIQFVFSYLLTTNLIGAVIGKIAGVPYKIGGIRNAYLDKNKLYIQRFIHNYLSTKTIFNNYKGLTELRQKGFKEEKATVIPNCFELNNAYLERAESLPVNIITVGRFVTQKGYEVALKTMKILLENGLNFNYIIVGYGPLENEIRNTIKRYALAKNVEVIINPSNIDDYYKKSDIYLCTSHFEGLSNTILEALSFSLPIVGTNVGDNDVLIKEGINGYLVQEPDEKLLVSPLTKLLTSFALRKKMGNKSFQLIEENFGGDAFTQNYIHFINTI